MNLRHLPQRLSEVYGCFGKKLKGYIEQVLKEENLKDVPILVVVVEEAMGKGGEGKKDVKEILRNMVAGRVARIVEVGAQQLGKEYKYFICRWIEENFGWLETEMMKISK